MGRILSMISRIFLWVYPGLEVVEEDQESHPEVGQEE